MKAWLWHDPQGCPGTFMLLVVKLDERTLLYVRADGSASTTEDIQGVEATLDSGSGFWEPL